MIEQRTLVVAPLPQPSSCSQQFCINLIFLTNQNEHREDDGGDPHAKDVVDEVASDDGEDHVGPRVPGVEVLELVSLDAHR